MHAVRKLPFFLINTLLLYIPLLALTDRQNYRQRLKYTCCMWAGGTFFSSCAVLSVFGSGEKKVLVYILMYLEYHTVVVLCQIFWFWREIVFGTYVIHTVVVLC